MRAASSPPRSAGFILLPVVFAITLVAAIAFMLARGGPMALEQAAADSQAALARRVAQAGMEHAIWRAERGACTGYALASTPFGAHSYSASYSASSGSPVNITVTATLADGVTRGLTRNNVAIHQAGVAVDLEAVADAHLQEDSADSAKGGENKIDIKTKDPSKRRQGVLRFNLTGIPFGARIVSASLSLMLKKSGSSAVPMAARRLTQSWKEAEVTWNSRQTGSTWTQAGGDMDLVSVSRASVGPTKDIRYTWDVTDMVAGWVAGTYDNNGLSVAGTDGNADEEFYSRDEADTTRRPKLSVTYACECGTVCAAPQGSGKVLLVVSDDSSPSSEDQYKKALFESWGYTVTYQDDSDNQTTFDTALAGQDVAYVSDSVNASTLSSKLLATTKGVVYEKGEQNSVQGLATGFGQAMGSSVDVIDNSHAITQGFATGALTLYRYAMEGLKASGTLAGGAQVLARWGADAGLIAVDKGAALTSGTAAGRRVMLPLGRKDKFNMAYLNNAGWLLVQRALTWAGEAVVDPLTVGLVAHWKLDESSGTNAEDSAGNHDGTLTNGPTWTSGQLNGALRLDGSNDYVNVPHDATLSLTNAFTFTAWIKPSSLSGYNVILAKGATASTMNYYLATYNNQLLVEYAYGGGTVFDALSGALALQSNVWQHVAASYNAATQQVVFYLGGVEVKRVTATSTPLTNTSALTIGQGPYGTSENWPGNLDDIRVYDRALDSAEVMQLANPGGGGGGGTCSGTFRDEFKATNYSGSDGTLAWATNWTEVNESDGATSGDEIVGTDQSNYQLRVQDNDSSGEGVMRQADLSDYTSATLTFDYRRVGLDDSNDWVAAQVSKNGGAWVELGRFKGSGTDSSYQAASYDLTAYIAANVRIRFIGSSNLGSSDAVWFDNVQIAVSGCAP